MDEIEDARIYLQRRALLDERAQLLATGEVQGMYFAFSELNL
jgi:hypothetical protein